MTSAALAEQRAQLTFHLIEELRHDLPHVSDRIDSDAVAMGQPADTQAVLEAIRESTVE